MAKTILVVDDSQPQCELLKVILQDAGFDVVTANDSERAFELVESEKPGLMLLDLVLAEGDNSIELFKRVKDKYPGFKALIYTGFGPEEEVRLIVEAVQAGMIDEYLRKPMAPEEVVAAVKKHI